MIEPCILAIDPGLTGALAFYFPSAPERIAVEDMPSVNGRIDVHALQRRIAQMGPTQAVIELVGAMPSTPGKEGKRRSMGATSAFNFGAACAAIETTVALSGVPTQMVTPQAWKKHHRVPGKAAGGEEAARALAIRLLPASAERFGRKKDHNRADAALIALFAADKLIPHSQAASRSGCAGNGEVAAPASPALGT